jgi:hypothetical protein
MLKLVKSKFINGLSGCFSLNIAALTGGNHGSNDDAMMNTFRNLTGS